MKLKNKIAAITSAAIVITSLLSGASAEENAQIRKIKGDINRDYIISVADAVALSHCLTGKAFLEEGDEYYADINNDGAVDAFDLMLLRRTILGIREQDIEEDESILLRTMELICINIIRYTLVIKLACFAPNIIRISIYKLRVAKHAL